MFKKFFIFLIALFLLTSCTKNLQTEVDNNTSPPNITDSTNDAPIDDKKNGAVNDIPIDDEKNDAVNDVPTAIQNYTGELITDGFYGDSGSLVFVPDKETKEYIKNNFSFNFEESMYLTYDDKEIIKDLPAELGIYKVEIEPNIEESDYYMKINSIKLTDKIGTVEYEGKTYETNNLDENVRVKDKVCGLIVDYVNFINEEEGVIIRFSGELEVEGYYSIYNGGDYYNYINIGKILADEESLKNFPTYKNEPPNKKLPSVYFHETNELYKKIQEHSSIGRGKFKISNYTMVGGKVGMENMPSKSISQIISLDDSYKGMFEFNDEYYNSIIAIVDNYALILESSNDENISNVGNYYVIDEKNSSKIHILATNGFYYEYKAAKNDSYVNDWAFTLTSNSDKSSNTVEHDRTIAYSAFDGTIIKELNYADFKDGENTITVYEGQKYLDMTVENISILYHCCKDSAEEFAGMQIHFSGETTVTGELHFGYDEAFESYSADFICDDEGAKNLPYHVEDTRSVGFRITNENLEQLFGTESFEKKCKITIKDYFINFSATEARNTAEAVTIEYLTE